LKKAAVDFGNDLPINDLLLQAEEAGKNQDNPFAIKL
jgi:hypothetical protein